MSVNRVYKFQDIGEVQAFLNGGLIGGDVKSGVLGLVGTRLTFSQPSFYVDFAAVTPAPDTRDAYKLLFADIKAQVEAANNAILVTQLGGKIVLIEKTPTNGISLSSNDEVAKALLGFDRNNARIGKVYSPPNVTGAAQNWMWAYSVNESTHVIYTWE